MTHAPFPNAGPGKQIPFRQRHEVPVVPEILADDDEIEAVRVPLPAVLPDESEPSFARLAVTTE